MIVIAKGEADDLSAAKSRCVEQYECKPGDLRAERRALARLQRIGGM